MHCMRQARPPRSGATVSVGEYEASALHVAEEAADHALFRAVFIARVQRFVFCGSEPPSLPPAVTAARVCIIDGERGTAAPDRRDDPARVSLALCERIA